MYTGLDKLDTGRENAESWNAPTYAKNYSDDTGFDEYNYDDDDIDGLPFVL